MVSPSHIALDLLTKAHPPDIASAIFTEKILHKPLRLRPTSPDPNSQDARARRRLLRLRKKEKSRRKKRPKPLSAKEKRMSGIYEIPKQSQKYEIYVPLHRMWLEYFWEILGMRKGERNFITPQAAGPRIASADFHGAKLTVTRSKCVSLVGLKGIVVRDTKFTFQVITKRNEMKSICHLLQVQGEQIINRKLAIPKNHTIFRFRIPQPEAEPEASDAELHKDISDDESGANALIFEIHGDAFKIRAVDRATKKFKQRNMAGL
ncbi:MAG: hypothetical protein Q9219_005227 [cf. Caloplaca sp. 3 TL-2023]